MPFEKFTLTPSTFPPTLPPPRSRVAARATPPPAGRRVLLARKTAPQVIARAVSEVDANPTMPHNPDEPTIVIDNKKDEFATVVTIEHVGDLGDLNDLTRALTNLGMDVIRGSIAAEAEKGFYTFYLTEHDTSNKLLTGERIEELRCCVLYTLMEMDNELEFLSSTTREKGKRTRKDLPTKIPTSIRVSKHASGTRTVVQVRTFDRPGVLNTIVKCLKDISVNVVSAEIDTVGGEVIDTFFVTYHGKAVTHDMEVLITNVLQYTLGLPLVKEDSY